MKKIIAVFFMFTFIFIFGTSGLQQIETNKMNEKNVNSYSVENYKSKIEYPKGMFVDIYA